MLVTQAIGLHGAGQRCEQHTTSISRTVTLLRQLQRALAHLLRKHLGFGNVVHEAPVFRLLSAYALGAGTKNVGQVMPHMALVGDAGQATRSRQHTEQGNLGQADRRGAVVHQDDLVTGQRQLVTTTGTGTIHGRQELQPAVPRCILQTVAGLIGELAEVDLPGMAADAQHENIRARAEHPVLQAGQHYRANFGMLEADAVDGVMQFDVHPQVITVELELVAWAQPRVFVKISAQGGHRAIEAEFPMPVLGGLSPVVHGVRNSHESVS